MVKVHYFFLSAVKAFLMKWKDAQLVGKEAENTVQMNTIEVHLEILNHF